MDNLSKPYVVIVLVGGKTIERYRLLPGVYDVGRSPQAFICLPADKTVSRLHARIRVNESLRVEVTDLSRNGTKLDRHFLRGQTKSWPLGRLVRIGAYVLGFDQVVKHREEVTQKL